MKMTTAKAGKGKTHRKIRHMSINPAKNGFTTETHYDRPEGEKGMFMDNQPDTNVHESPEAMLSHVASTFGAKAPAAAPPAKPGKSAGKAAPPPAEDEEEE